MTSPQTSKFLELDNLEKRFGGAPVTRGVSLEVRQSEILALLGPSGSGKTTILRLVAGFESPDAGRILVGGEDVTALAPERRRFGMVFQHYALFPHMTVAENVAFGLDGRALGRDAARRRVAEMLSSVGLRGLEDRPVTRLSGGQQQRVALARALAPGPRVLLLDEPLSNLDPTLRERTRRELARIIRETGITTLFVTHEQEEAFDLGDRIAVLNDGRIEQVGTPEALYEEPAGRFVATFVGCASVLPGTWEEGSSGAVRLDAGPLWPAAAGSPLRAGDSVDLVVRPESVAFAPAAGPETLAGAVTTRRFAGREAYFEVALDAAGSVEVLGASRARAIGDRVFVAPGAGGPPPRAFPRQKPAG